MIRARPPATASIAGVAAALCLAALAHAQETAVRSATGAPRTAWGTPDLQGTWTGSTITPLERPKEFANQPVLTPQEAAALEARARARNAAEPPVPAGDPGTYNQIWFDPSSAVVPDRRTSLIVDPPDGRIPFTPRGRELATRASDHYGTGPRDSHVDFDTGERCLTDGIPIPYWTGYNNNYQIVQTRDHLVIFGEMYHNLRVIPLDGRPRTGVPRWLGESLGRWDKRHADRRDRRLRRQVRVLVGDQLASGAADAADGGAFHADRRGDDRLRVHDGRSGDVHASVDRETPLTTNQAARGVTEGRLYEYACHEANYSLVNVLRGARMKEQVGAAR